VIFVALVLGGLGLLMIGGFVVLYAKIGALADELRDARAQDATAAAAQLTDIAGKLQGLRVDLSAQRRSLEELTAEMKGPPSMRRPPISGAA
jgi:hypothetical protein